MGRRREGGSSKRSIETWWSRSKRGRTPAPNVSMESPSADAAPAEVEQPEAPASEDEPVENGATSLEATDPAGWLLIRSELGFRSSSD